MHSYVELSEGAYELLVHLRAKVCSIYSFDPYYLLNSRYYYVFGSAFVIEYIHPCKACSLQLELFNVEYFIEISQCSQVMSVKLNTAA